MLAAFHVRSSLAAALCLGVLACGRESTVVKGRPHPAVSEHTGEVAEPPAATGAGSAGIARPPPPMIWLDGPATSPPSFANVQGWGPLRFSMNIDEATAALDTAKVAFDKKTAHKTGDKYLTLKDPSPHGWGCTVYFSESRPHTINQILLITSSFATAAEAEAVLAEHVRRFGPAAEAKPGYHDELREDREYLWHNPATDLDVTVSHNRFRDLQTKRSIAPEDTSEQLDYWVVFITYRPHR
jgi:hypothetical protein